MNAIRIAFVSSVVICCLLMISASVAMAADGIASGVIVLNGEPLTGKITFYRGDQFVGTKFKDGKYAVDRLKPGTYKVTIEGNGVPAKYSSEEKAGLEVTVEEGNNTLDFEIND